jgi:hypothetical protein
MKRRVARPREVAAILLCHRPLLTRERRAHLGSDALAVVRGIARAQRAVLLVGKLDVADPEADGRAGDTLDLLDLANGATGVA